MINVNCISGLQLPEESGTGVPEVADPCTTSRNGLRVDFDPLGELSPPIAFQSMLELSIHCTEV